MRVNNRSNIRFGSHIIFESPATPENTAKLVDNFRILDCASGFSTPKTPVKAMTSITSILDKNDSLVIFALKQMGIKVKQTIPSMQYYTQRFKDKENPVKAAQRFIQSGWKTKFISKLIK